MKEFVPLGLLRNPHLMTLAAAFWPRKFSALGPSVPRLFQVEPGTQLLGHCHWQEAPREHPTLIVLHGLEGSSESNYMLGTAEKAWVVGFNAVRLNQRNCGGTEALTPTLYHSGLSGDIRAVMHELIERDGLPEIFAAGFSMGGNLVLKMAGEVGDGPPPQFRAVAAVAPALDLASCAAALEDPQNFVYARHFVRGLKNRMRRKARLFPGKFPLDGLDRVRTVWEFDEVVTARFCGFAGAEDYYTQSSARRFIAAIHRPTLIMTAEDDPFVPFAPFQYPVFRENRNITLVTPKHGGHCGFISTANGAERFWAEARIVEFCKSQSKM